MAIIDSPTADTQSQNGVRIVGPEEIVFDWTRDRCDEEDIPDMPARAFRDAEGNVQLIATHNVVRRMIGTDLDAVRRDCTIVMRSHRDPDPANFNDAEWLTSPYTIDGRTIYALVHNEYHGWEHPGQCPRGISHRHQCWYNGITFALSTDGGRSYTHPTAPQHLVASLPYTYEPGRGPTGIFSPSSIVFNPKDGYYYALVRIILGGPERGTCLIRTQTLADPRSWRAWDGEGFNVRFINPYTEPVANPDDHLCEPVSPQEIATMHESLTFNTYFDKFLLVGTAGQRDRTTGRVIWGFYYSLSEDLIHWTPRRLIMEAKQAHQTDVPGDILVYPSLIDPQDESRNFEITGRWAYLYYTRWHQGFDRDLVRVLIEFHK